MQDIHGKVAFVTGGDSGIGLAVVKALRDAGARVVFTYRRDDHRDMALQALSGGNGIEPTPVHLDVTNREQFRAVAEHVESDIGPVQILCNSAGVNYFGPLETSTYADWDWVMGVNVGGIVNSMVSLLPRMLERRLPGHIVNIGSMASYLSGPVAGVYTASKFAVRGVTECLRYSLHSKGIGVSLVCPGLTKTNIHEAVLFRPKELADAGAPATTQNVENIRRVMDSGMDPALVAERVLLAITQNLPLVFSHPGYEDDFEQIYREALAALPNELPTEDQLYADNAFRDFRRKALADA